ncbi:MAG: putative deoxyribonuclease YcfH [Verrucomicrobiota bacterium]
MIFSDAHCHLHFVELAPHLPRVLTDLAVAGVRRLVVNGTCEADWPAVAALCAASHLSAPASAPQLLPSYGLHPWDAGARSPVWLATLRACLVADPRSHVGEVGLDRWIIDDLRPDDPRLAGVRVAPLDEQADVLSAQLALAAELNRAASIHCLRAIGPLHGILRAAALPARGFLLHAYSGPLELVRPLADLGAYFSFNGYFLRARHAAKSRVFAAVPLDRLLVETDAPAMRLPAPREKFPPLPAPDGSLANHPANLVATYAALAELRGVPLESLAAHVEENFQRLFAR